jgi:hypothetical protein
MFWLVGTVATAATAMALDVPATGLALMMSMFLAFATLFPDYQILLLFVFPVKVKWLGILDACALAWTAFNAPGLEKLIPVAAVGNYLLFFGPTLVGLFRQGATVASRTRARERFDAAAPVRERRVCALCGVTDEDPSVEFRVCTCAKCGKPTEYCLAHARNH